MNESENNLEGRQEENTKDHSDHPYTDPYVSESSADIYTAPQVVETDAVVEETPAPVAVVDTHGLFSGNQQQNAGADQAGSGYPNYGGQTPYGNQEDGGYGRQASGDYQTPYGSHPAYNSQNPYGSQDYYGNQTGSRPPYGNQSGYGGQPSYYGPNPYGSQDAYGNQQPYGSQTGSYGEQAAYTGQAGSYGEQMPYTGQPGSNGEQTAYTGQAGSYGEQMPYTGQTGGNGEQTAYTGQAGSYGEQPPYTGQAGGNGEQPPYTGQTGGYGGQPPYGNQPGYGGQASYNGQNPYGNPAGGGYGGLPPFGGQPPYNNPYSPYAAPRKKQHAGLIVGIVVAIILLFLIAVFALAGKVVKMLSEKEKEDLRRDVYDFDDYDYDYDHHDDYDYDYDTDDGYYDYDYDPYDDYDDYYGYGDDYGYYEEEYDDRYYTLQQDIKYDLSYQIELEDYEYETDYENVMITATVPVISGEDVPNLDKLNEGIRKEVEQVTELFEEDYEAHIKEDEDSYFGAMLVGYVTYMDEDKLSIAYQEEIDSDLGGGVYLISINIDMKSGVILDNEEMLTTDDEFSVDFRKRSEEQNGEIAYLYYMTDQQITEYFNSDNIIVFYTPKGMEIGFNYEEGWVTVTYEDYEPYLKVF